MFIMLVVVDKAYWQVMIMENNWENIYQFPSSFYFDFEYDGIEYFYVRTQSSTAPYFTYIYRSTTEDIYIHFNYISLTDYAIINHSNNVPRYHAKTIIDHYFHALLLIFLSSSSFS